MKEYGKFFCKFLGYAAVFMVLIVIFTSLSTLIIGIVVQSISDCNGMGCFGEGIRILVFGALSGLIIAIITLWLLMLRLEFWELEELPQGIANMSEDANADDVESARS